MMERRDALSRIADEVRVCKKCQLWKSRTLAVPGEGPLGAEVVIVGEAPGRNEDLKGRPFVGAAGKNLDELLGEAGLDRSSVFITNVVKCRPPSNRRPTKKESDTCNQYLRRQIELLAPRILVLLGDVALRQFFPDATLSKTHGKTVKRGGARFFPTYHPAAMIYDPTLRSVLAEDFRVLRKELGSRGHNA